jgi:citronellyl-CoA dehydrogenase
MRARRTEARFAAYPLVDKGSTVQRRPGMLVHVILEVVVEHTVGAGAPLPQEQSMNPFTSEHELFRKTVRDFCVKEIAPYSAAWDEAGIFPKEIFKRVGELGFLGIDYPEELGGSGLDYWYVTAWVEEMCHARNGGCVLGLLVQAQMATPIIRDIGTPAQKQEFLVPALRGDKIAALGVTEPEAGSDVASLRTTAKRVGGDYVINGAKTFITNGTRADFITLVVRTGDEGYGGISLILFPTDTKGFTVSKSIKKLGNLASDTGLLSFEDCRVPARNLLGEENQGFLYIIQNFQGERLVAAISAVAGMQLMIDDAVAYTRERKAFGKPVIKFQVWRHKIAEHLTAIEAARQLTYHAVDKFNRKQPAVREISMAKLFAGDLAQRVAYDCLQMHGGAGYMAEVDISRAFRDIRLITIGGGTSEILKEIIGKIEGL